MNRLLVITGNPGVGKHTVGEIIARKLGLSLIDINAVATTKNAILVKDRMGFVVDLRKLASLLRREMKRDCIMVGHLAPYVLRRTDPGLVVVLRRSPYELKKVYGDREYDEQKTSDNISSEIIGVCLYDAVKKFGRDRVAEMDSTAKKAENVANEILSVMKQRSKPSVGKVDWLSLIAKNDDLHKFFAYN